MAKDDIKVGSKICGPACGVGKFLLEPIITKLDQFYERCHIEPDWLLIYKLTSQEIIFERTGSHSDLFKK